MKFSLASFLTNMVLAAITLFLIFHIGTANAQYYGEVDSNTGDTFTIIFNDANYANMYITTPTEFEVDFGDLTRVPQAEGNFSLVDSKGETLAYFNYLAGNTYWFTYGVEKLHIKFAAY